MFCCTCHWYRQVCMAGRPRRPERETIFRPFSSRDANSLLQLKCSKQVATGPLVNTVLKYALRMRVKKRLEILTRCRVYWLPSHEAQRTPTDRN